MQAPSVLGDFLPADLVAVPNCSHRRAGSERGETESPSPTSRWCPQGASALRAGSASVQEAKGAWTGPPGAVINLRRCLLLKGVRPASASIRVDEFRSWFPGRAVLHQDCPCDEVVTLTLYHREDQPLIRLLLNESEAAELERLWAELWFVSQDAPGPGRRLREQLWQFATVTRTPRCSSRCGSPSGTGEGLLGRGHRRGNRAN